jgi:cytochrome c biogenesis protein CcmG/thiol:disulfide interchange protein DsbE
VHLLFAWLLATAPLATVKLPVSGSAKVGFAAPAFGGWDLTGRNVLTFDGLRRNPTISPLLITFGASWCTACASGLPRLKALTQKHQDNLRLIFIDVELDADKAQQFAAKMGIDGPALLDKFEQIAKTYGVAGDEKTSLPRTFLIDEKGKVRAIYREEGADLEKVIEADLVAARQPVPPVTAR